MLTKIGKTQSVSPNSGRHYTKTPFYRAINSMVKGRVYRLIYVERALGFGALSKVNERGWLVSRF